MPKIKRFVPYLLMLRDVRVLGMTVFSVLVLLVTWSGIKVIQGNYELQRRIARLEQENAVKQLENSNLKLKNHYFETDQFLELAARRQFGLGAPGEKLLIVPSAVALKHTVDIPQTDTKQLAKELVEKSNLQAWLEFFFNRR